MRTLVVLTGLFCSADAFAGRCSIKNETGISFKVESGNTSNQSVGSHTSTSISSGTIIGKSDDGKAVSGSCADGDKIKIIEDKGVPVILPQ